MFFALFMEHYDVVVLGKMAYPAGQVMPTIWPQAVQGGPMDLGMMRPILGLVERTLRWQAGQCNERRIRQSGLIHR
jgi:hypothetical protein